MLSPLAKGCCNSARCWSTSASCSKRAIPSLTALRQQFDEVCFQVANSPPAVARANGAIPIDRARQVPRVSFAMVKRQPPEDWKSRLNLDWTRSPTPAHFPVLESRLSTFDPHPLETSSPVNRAVDPAAVRRNGYPVPAGAKSSPRLPIRRRGGETRSPRRDQSTRLPRGPPSRTAPAARRPVVKSGYGLKPIRKCGRGRAFAMQRPLPADRDASTTSCSFCNGRIGACARDDSTISNCVSPIENRAGSSKRQSPVNPHFRPQKHSPSQPVIASVSRPSSDESRTAAAPVRHVAAR